MGTHYQGSPEFVRALDTFIKLIRGTESLKARIGSHVSGRDISDTQFGVLEALYHLGPLHQNEVGKKLLISKSNVVAVIDKLEDHGLVKRERSSEDRRYIFIHLTGDGREAIEDLLPLHVAAITEELSCLSPKEQEELGRLCRKLGLKE